MEITKRTAIELTDLFDLAACDLNQYLGPGRAVTVFVRATSFENSIPQLRRGLTPEEQQQCGTFNSKSIAQRFIIYRGILRVLIARCLRLAENTICFEKTDYNKPYLQSLINNRDLRFNLSHSKDLAIYAFSYRREIGIDIEAVNARMVGLSAAEMVLASSELEALDTLPSKNRILKFLRLWTQKEAVSKALGLGFALNFKEMVLGFELETNSELKIMDRNIAIHDISQYDEYLATLAIDISKV